MSADGGSPGDRGVAVGDVVTPPFYKLPVLFVLGHDVAVESIDLALGDVGLVFIKEGIESVSVEAALGVDDPSEVRVDCVDRGLDLLGDHASDFISEVACLLLELGGFLLDLEVHHL